MALAELTAVERHRQVAGDVSARVRRVADWDAPDPVAWRVHTDAVQALLDEPDRSAVPLSQPQVGSRPVSEAVDRSSTPDVFTPLTAAPRGLDSTALRAYGDVLRPPRSPSIGPDLAEPRLTLDHRWCISGAPAGCGVPPCYPFICVG